MRKNKYLFIFIAVLLVLSTVIFFIFASSPVTFQADTVNIRPIASEISATGDIQSYNQATLHFQTGGEVTYLPYKIGDHVYSGATIAQLDTNALQKQLTAALNTYKSTRDQFDQTQENNQNGNLQNQQKLNLDTYTTSPVDNTNAINDIVNRVLDENQATLDNSVINVQLANYALQLATLTSPINGVVTGEDITTPNVNVTPVTSFSVADPTTPVFKAQVLESDIDYVAVGATATIQLNGLQKTLTGVVSKIEPQKIIDPSGNYYIVDIDSTGLSQNGTLGQSGNVLIQNEQSGQHLLIPAWTVLGHTSVWVLENNKPMLKQVVTGDTHGTDIEIIHGLSANDKIITNPQSLAKLHYSIL